jgi:hypothetical protein
MDVQVFWDVTLSLDNSDVSEEITTIRTILPEAKNYLPRTHVITYTM